jgi:hypothetical protein
MATTPTRRPALDACFEEGHEARAKGLLPTDNPYRHDSAEWREWRAGWEATLDLDEEDDPASNRLHPEDEVPPD